eukprot:scpid102893/ scgid26148/ 
MLPLSTDQRWSKRSCWIDRHSGVRDLYDRACTGQKEADRYHRATQMLSRLCAAKSMQPLVRVRASRLHGLCHRGYLAIIMSEPAVVLTTVMYMYNHGPRWRELTSHSSIVCTDCIETHIATNPSACSVHTRSCGCVFNARYPERVITQCIVLWLAATAPTSTSSDLCKDV